jgi:hypothetical protein
MHPDSAAPAALDPALGLRVPRLPRVIAPGFTTLKLFTVMREGVTDRPAPCDIDTLALVPTVAGASPISNSRRKAGVSDWRTKPKARRSTAQENFFSGLGRSSEKIRAIASKTQARKCGEALQNFKRRHQPQIDQSAPRINCDAPSQDLAGGLGALPCLSNLIPIASVYDDAADSQALHRRNPIVSPCSSRPESYRGLRMSRRRRQRTQHPVR